MGAVFHELAHQKESKIHEGHIMSDHVHMAYFKPHYGSFPQIVTPITQLAGNPPRFCVRPSRGFFI